MESVRTFLWNWFSELNWKSLGLYALWAALFFGSPEAQEYLNALLPMHWTVKIVALCKLIGALGTIWTRSPAVTPLGTVGRGSNVR